PAKNVSKEQKKQAKPNCRRREEIRKHHRANDHDEAGRHEYARSDGPDLYGRKVEFCCRTTDGSRSDSRKDDGDNEPNEGQNKPLCEKSQRNRRRKQARRILSNILQLFFKHPKDDGLLPFFTGRPLSL